MRKGEKRRKPVISTPSTPRLRRAGEAERSIYVTEPQFCHLERSSFAKWRMNAVERSQITQKYKMSIILLC
jgi:hypothetical protein